MRKIQTSLILLLLLFCFAQNSQAQGTVEAGIGGLLNYQFISSTKQSTADSLRDLSKAHMSFQAGLRVNFNIKKDWGCQIGIGYARYNSRFERVGLRFHDSIHPALGRIEDLSEAATKTVVYRYNFDYIDIPINFTYRLTVRKGAAYYTPYVIVGFNNEILLNHNLRIDTKGFSINGENIHKIKETGWTATQYNLLMNLGARFEIKLDKKTQVVLQPEFKLPLLKSTESDPTLRYGAAGIWLGIARKI
jgi:hypothetical protein